MNDQTHSQAPSTTVRELPTTAMDQALTQAITKAELDQAIATAQAMPRSVKAFLSECKSLATLTTQIASECIYALPRREQGVTKMIEGPSARLAEIVAHAWGNCRAGARVVDEGREFITAQGVFHDLEKNVHITYEVRRRITNSAGRRYSADMIAVTGNAACSIALRNAVFKGVPKAFWNDIYLAARQVIAGDAKTLANRRSDALAHFQKIGAPQDLVLNFLGVKGIEDITLDHLTQLIGIANAIKEGEITVEEAFAKPEPQKVQNGTSSTTARAKELLRGGNGNGNGEQKQAEQPPAEQPAQEQPADEQPEQGEQDLGGYVPQFDKDSAIAELRKAKSKTALAKAWKAVCDDYDKSSREIPVDIEAVYRDRRESLEG